ncbi:uncharacterized protein LOC108744045 [Agrilus planipennis]|uniref:Uncharacterized protein LOC108744045 n=1 Tax=Agrilus planipennis TaxID=224129 RepID=A0A1W4XRV0_AGRPL|nr:uncharacterized protein LOC108744045 [Agrilus planipennis]
MYSGKIMSNQKPPTLLDSKVIPANGKYLAVLKQLPQSGEASQEKKSFQNLQTTTTSSGDNIVLKRLVFDTEKRCFRAVDSNELVNAMSKKIRVLSVNHEGIDGMSSLNVLQKVPPLLLDGTECPEKESSFMEGIVPVSTDDMCILCARKMSPTHNISHLVNLIRDIAGVNLSNLNLPLRACEECVADVNVTLRLRNTIKRAYEDLVKKDDTFTMNVLPPKTAGQHGKSPVNETDTIASKEASTTVTEKSSVTHQENMNTDDSEIMQKLNEHNPDGFKQIKLLKGDDCGRKISSGDNYSKYHMNSETEKICEQLCITNSSQKEHLRECKKADVICKVCNRSFRTLQNLRWHMRCHVYKCEVCCKTFLYGIAKKNHLKEEHTEQEVQKSLENMKTDKEKSKFVPYCSRQTVILKTMKEEKEQIEVKEETENIINGIKQEEVIL